MKEFIDKTSTQSGTPINREAMMAIQGFETKKTIFDGNERIIETNANGETKTTFFDSDGSITEIFVGKKTITKKTIFNDDGSITEVIS